MSTTIIRPNSREEWLEVRKNGIGSRLCFKNPELAKYAGRQFIGLCTDFYLTRK